MFTAKWMREGKHESKMGNKKCLKNISWKTLKDGRRNKFMKKERSFVT
jgi:hypothetical protein